MPIQLRTTSQLDELTASSDLNGAYIAVSQKVNDNPKQYASKKASMETFSKKVFNEVSSSFLEFGLTPETNFSDMNKYISTLISGTNSVEDMKGYVYGGEHDFEKLPKFHDFLSGTEGFANENDFCAINLKTLKEYEKSGNSLLINKGSDFRTIYQNVETQISQDLSGIQNAPSTDMDKHNRFVFQISAYESNVWVSPADGMFTCYGWVDVRDSIDLYNAKYWVALEGEFEQKNEDNSIEPFWRILSLQPIYPNQFCSYVSFIFPVNRGMKLRLKTGFNVGTNSDKYASIQGSLTNHVPNAFVGGVYVKDMFVSSEDEGTPSLYSDATDIYLENLNFNLSNENMPSERFVLSGKMHGGYPDIVTSLEKTRLVNWLSADILRAIQAYLPPTIVTKIDSSNIKIVPEENTGRLSVYNVVSATSVDIGHLAYDWTATTYSTSGESVPGMACSTDGNQQQMTSMSQTNSIEKHDSQNNGNDSVVEENEDERNYSKLIEDISKEIED